MKFFQNLDSDLLELIAIIIASIFGILGAVTDTKDKRGRLTRWGLIAIIGIIVTNAVSLLTTYLKQQNEHQREIARKDTDAMHYRNQIIAEQKILGKSDTVQGNLTTVQKRTTTLLSDLQSSLDEQASLQRISTGINGKVQQNLDSQKKINQNTNSILGIQKRTLERQSQLDSDIVKTLNPFIPFGITFTVEMSVHAVEGAPPELPPDSLNKANDDFLKVLAIRGRNDSKYGIFERRIPGSKDIKMILTSKYKYKADFAYLQNLSIILDFFEKNIDRKKIVRYDSVYKTNRYPINGSFHGNLIVSPLDKYQQTFTSDTLYNDNMFPTVYIEYRTGSDSYYVTFFSNYITFSDKSSLRSINDLFGSNFLISLLNEMPQDTHLKHLTFHFPPSFSRHYTMLLADSGGSTGGTFRALNVFK